MAFKSLDDLEFVEPEGQVLGEGGFSQVKLVRMKTNKKLYALKCINLKLISPVHFANLKKEIKIHQTLWHPHIIRFEGAIQEEHMVYILLEYADNGALFFFINPRTGMPEKYAFKFFYQTAQALEYLHSKGIMHRDLKPENILLDKNYDAKLCDFGWCAEHEEQDPKQSICGTYEYMPPEIVHERPHNKEVDLWALGVLLYELIHGRAPYSAETLEDIKEKMRVTELTFKKSISKEAKDVMLQLLRADPRERITLEKVMRHAFVLKHRDDFESNRDAFKYIPPEPEWDNDIEVQRVAENNTDDTKKNFEDEILNDPIKQHEYITQKLAEAKINPLDVEKVYFLRDEKNNLKMRLQMKDRPLPKRGNSERQKTTSFSQRFKLSEKKEIGSPKREDASPAKFEDLLDDSAEKSIPTKSLADGAKAAEEFLKNLPGAPPFMGDEVISRQDIGPINLTENELEYNLLAKDPRKETHKHTEEISPSELGSPRRSELDSNLGGSTFLHQIQRTYSNDPSVPENGEEVAGVSQHKILNPYNVTGIHRPAEIAQKESINQINLGNNQQTSQSPAPVVPLSLNNGRDKTPSNLQKTEDTSERPKQQDFPSQPVIQQQTQPTMITIKSSVNMMNIGQGKDNTPAENLRNAMTPPASSFTRPLNPLASSLGKYPGSVANIHGISGLQSGSNNIQYRPYPEKDQGGAGVNQPAFQNPAPSNQYGYSYTNTGTSQQPTSYNWQNPWHQGGTHGVSQTYQPSNLNPTQFAQSSMQMDFKIKSEPDVKKAEPVNPLKTSLGQFNQFAKKDGASVVQIKSHDASGPKIPNAAMYQMKSPNLGPREGEQLSAEKRTAAELAGLNRDLNKESTIPTSNKLPGSQFQSAMNKPEQKQTNQDNQEQPKVTSFRQITQINSPFKSEKLIGQGSDKKDKPIERVALDDVSQRRQPEFKTSTGAPSQGQGASQTEPVMISRKFSADLEEAAVKNIASQHAASYHPMQRIYSGTNLHTFQGNQQQKPVSGTQANTTTPQVSSFNQPSLWHPAGNSGQLQSTPTSGSLQYSRPQDGKPLDKQEAAKKTDQSSNLQMNYSQGLQLNLTKTEPMAITITSKKSNDTAQWRNSIPDNQKTEESGNESRERSYYLPAPNDKSSKQAEATKITIRSTGLGGQYEVQEEGSTLINKPASNDSPKFGKEYIRDAGKINQIINSNKIEGLGSESPAKKAMGSIFQQYGAQGKPPISNPLSTSLNRGSGQVKDNFMSTTQNLAYDYQKTVNNQDSFVERKKQHNMSMGNVQLPSNSEPGNYWRPVERKDSDSFKQFNGREEPLNQFNERGVGNTNQPDSAYQKITISSRKESVKREPSPPAQQQTYPQNSAEGKQNPIFFQTFSKNDQQAHTGFVNPTKQTETKTNAPEGRAAATTHDRSRSQSIIRKENTSGYGLNSSLVGDQQTTRTTNTDLRQHTTVRVSHPDSKHQISTERRSNTGALNSHGQNAYKPISSPNSVARPLSFPTQEAKAGELVGFTAQNYKTVTFAHNLTIEPAKTENQIPSQANKQDTTIHPLNKSSEFMGTMYNPTISSNNTHDPKSQFTSGIRSGNYLNLENSGALPSKQNIISSGSNIKPAGSYGGANVDNKAPLYPQKDTSANIYTPKSDTLGSAWNKDNVTKENPIQIHSHRPANQGLVSTPTSTYSQTGNYAWNQPVSTTVDSTSNKVIIGRPSPQFGQIGSGGVSTPTAAYGLTPSAKQTSTSRAESNPYAFGQTRTVQQTGNIQQTSTTIHSKRY